MSTRTENGTLRRTQVTARDLDVLLSLYKHRFLALSQLERLHFVSAQTTARRLRLLAEAGYVSLFRSPAVSERIAMLTQKGLGLVAARLDLRLQDLGASRGRLEPKDAYFLRHHLAIADFRIALTRACDGRSDLRLLGFLADHVVERTDRGALRRFTRDIVADIAQPGDKITHTPDGVFALSFKETPALFFLEVDRGTETVSDRERGVAKILRFYLSFLTSGGYARYQDVFGVTAPFAAVRVLVATSSKRRIATIRSVCETLGVGSARALQFIWLTEIALVHEHSIFNQIWIPLDPRDAATYRIAPERDPSVSDEGMR